MIRRRKVADPTDDSEERLTSGGKFYLWSML
jgi:hypothetical protein